jgi:nucleotide-binding universal stress UspA family protein
MLVPLDGSELANVVCPYVRELAGRLNLNLVFLNVCHPNEVELLPMHQAYIESAVDNCLLRFKEAQETKSVGERIMPPKARGEVVIGHPAEEILQYAEKNNFDLILIASHGHSGIKNWVLGSNANKILRTSKIPVWLVKAGIPEEIVYDKWPRRTMLVPLDGSILAESVLPHVKAGAKRRGADLVDIVLLRVCEEPFITSDYPEGPDQLSWDEHVIRMKNRCKEVAEEYLAKVQNRLENAGLKVRSEVLIGKPADEIINYAHTHPFNLIAISTHGYSGITQWAYGSVSDKVLHRVSSPVFLIRPHH